MKRKLTHSQLLERLSYDRRTGTFTWRVTCQRNLVGKTAGHVGKDGYRGIKIDCVHYPASHLAWFYVNGVWPEDKIDHRNGDRDCNAIKNLREATSAQNSHNYAKPRHNTSGYIGVTRHKGLGKWQASIKINNRNKYLGVRDTLEEAHKLYLDAKKVLHPFQPFPRGEAV